MADILHVMKLDERACLPFHGSKYAAGYDLYSCLDHPVRIMPGETKPIGTGIAVEIPSGCFGAVYARSGMALKRGLRPANCVGVIDSDYTGEIIVALHNDSGTVQIVGDGERIAQLVIQPCKNVAIVETNMIANTERGGAGFGSTGVK